MFADIEIACISEEENAVFSQEDDECLNRVDGIRKMSPKASLSRISYFNNSSSSSNEDSKE